MAEVEGSQRDTGDQADVQDVHPDLTLECGGNSGNWGGYMEGRIRQTHQARPWRRTCRIGWMEMLVVKMAQLVTR